MSSEIPDQALVVVADGGKATLLRRTGSGEGVTLREERHLTPKHLSEQGPSGSRPEDQTPQQTDEATFAKQLAHALFSMHERGDFKSMVLIADPQTLGQLRASMHKVVEGSIVRTLAKDLTNHSVKDIEAALAK